MNPYLTIYVPKDRTKPACCAHDGGVGLLSGKGPDADAGHGPGGGTVYGGTYQKDQPWRVTAAGWWYLEVGHRPQDLARMSCHPRIIAWTVVRGSEDGHWWRVPVFLTPNGRDHGKGYTSALDRIFTPDGYRTPEELEQVQRDCLAVATGVPLADTAEERDRLCALLAVRLLQFGQWVDLEYLAAKEWLTESVQLRVLRAAIGVDPELEVIAEEPSDVQH